MLTGEEAAALVLPLIEGMVEEPLWARFVAQLRQCVQADYASVVFRPIPFGQPQSRVVHLASGAESPPLVAQLYRDSLYKEDPLPYFALAEGRAYALEDLLRSGDPAHDRYRRTMLAPSGMNVLRILRFEEPGGISAWLTISRRSGAFSERTAGLLADLLPYLRAALAAHVALERQRNAAQVAGDVIRRLKFGWLALDAAGHILDADAQAEGVLAGSHQLMRARNGRLTARAADVAEAIARAVRDMAGDAQARPRAVVLSRDPWLDMLLVPASLRQDTAGPAASLIAYVHADHWSSADRAEQIGQLFDLIPCEARVALALSRGMSITEAASDLGLTVESARTYSKRIYAKTGARGQADLVRFVHRSVLAIA
jgi:DNA-binding CsgD family transcriptional regulator